jgi:hypothetical protein
VHAPLHNDSACRPVSDDHVPAGHRVGAEVELYGQNVPAGHALHVVAPALENVPGPQVDTRVEVQREPAGQVRHADDPPARAYVPVAQAPHAVADPPRDELPGAHGEHVDVAAVKN